jgi:hypothetical protein
MAFKLIFVAERGTGIVEKVSAFGRAPVSQRGCLCRAGNCLSLF